MDKVRLGIIGVGNMGSGHIENIVAGKCPEIEVTAIADRKEDRRQWAIEKLPDVKVFTEGEDLIKSDACDAILIAVPHYQHPGLAACIIAFCSACTA